MKNIQQIFLKYGSKRVKQEAISYMFDENSEESVKDKTVYIGKDKTTKQHKKYTKWSRKNCIL